MVVRLQRSRRNVHVKTEVADSFRSERRKRFAQSAPIVRTAALQLHRIGAAVRHAAALRHRCTVSGGRVDRTPVRKAARFHAARKNARTRTPLCTASPAPARTCPVGNKVGARDYRVRTHSVSGISDLIAIVSRAWRRQLLAPNVAPVKEDRITRAEVAGIHLRDRFPWRIGTGSGIGVIPRIRYVIGSGARRQAHQEENKISQLLAPTSEQMLKRLQRDFGQSKNMIISLGSCNPVSIPCLWPLLHLVLGKSRYFYYFIQSITLRLRYGSWKV